MNTKYILLGFASLIIGLSVTIGQIIKFKNRQNDDLGFSVGKLGAGAMFIIIGLGMISQNL